MATAEAPCETAHYEMIVLEHASIHSKTFYPIDQLREYLTSDKIKEILNCQCSRCKADFHAIENTQKKPVDYVERITGGKESMDWTKTAYTIFGLLIYVRHPVFIIGFLNRNVSDSLLASQSIKPSLDGLGEYLGDYFQGLPSNRFAGFVSQVSHVFSKFAVPHMESGAFMEYGPSVVLPFIEEKEIGRIVDDEGHLTSEGANGRIFSFKIYDEYNKFLHADGIKDFARKKIETREFQDYLERNNLENAQRFQDKHIVKLIKAYRQDNSINLIFPLAKTNLNHLLREPVFEYDKERGGPLEDCHAWMQLLGIAKALSRLGGFDEDATNISVHLDLKPDNILVEQDGTWVITDFGQAAIAQTTPGGTPYVRGRSGTDAYAPPEIEKPGKFTRRYDIWSLGCVFLEVIAFVIYGYEGLKGSEKDIDSFVGLDHARRDAMEFEEHVRDERFFYRESPEGIFILKKAICKFMENAMKRISNVSNESKKSKDFMSSVMDLVKSMLEPDVDERIQIDDVVRRLEAAFEQASDTTTISNAPTMLPKPNEVDLGGSRLNNIPIQHCEDGAQVWNKYNLGAFENKNGDVRLRLLAVSNRSINGVVSRHGCSDNKFDRKTAKLVPQYAFRKSESSKTCIQLLKLSYNQPAEISDTRFRFSGSDLQDACTFQSKLTSQFIYASFPLLGVKVRKAVPNTGRFINWASRKVGSTRAQDSAEEFKRLLEFGSATVQLWVEQVDLAEQRFRGGNFDLLPSRVVLYFHTQKVICTIRMDTNWIMKAEQSETDSMVCFQPNVKNRDPHFVASWIRPSLEEFNAEYPAGIPLDPKVLQFYEDNDSFEADSCELTFQDIKAQKRFRKEYLDVKGQWDKERKEKEKTHGPTPVNRRDPVPHPDLLPQLPLLPRTKASLAAQSGVSARRLGEAETSTIRLA